MSQSTPFTLKVSGEAEIPLPAERAVINVKVSSEGINKASVSDEVLTAAKHVERLFVELSPKDESPEAKAASPLAHWSKTSLAATSYIPLEHYEKDEEKPKVRHYKGSIDFDIRFKEFKALGSFGARISSVPHVEVQDIQWIITEETRARYRPKLRQAAAKDAMARAQDYCGVLGCTNLRPVELDEENGYGSRHRTYHMASQELGAGYGEEDEGIVAVEFTRQEVKMSMSVGVTFHAE
ncbi:hypothetical protein Slin14017_G097060 [Septoria linicola]|nr:hypothetical protein Slin14017_G097060 [Septoria linicola]